MKQRQYMTTVSLIVALTGLSPVMAANVTYRPIDYPGASQTWANAVNRTSSTFGFLVEVVGTYVDIQGEHGFLLSRGQYTTLDVPGGTSTTALGINDRHEIVGTYRDRNNGLTCNYKYSQGTYTHILDSCDIGHNHDSVRGINNAGALVGRTCCNGLAHHTGFVKSPTFFSNRLDVPGSTETEIRGIDNNAVPRMVGYYRTADGHSHGALFTGNQTTGMSFDFVPGAYSTVTTGINDSGQIVGWFTDALNRNRRGFLRFLDGGQGDITFNYPGGQHTQANGVSNPDSIGRFNVVGTYFPQGSLDTHGFIATLSPELSPLAVPAP
jgi:uncharacterized membrane protein